MAEAIALGASIIAIIQTADRIASLCKFYIQATSDAPSDIRSILLEISTLKAILQNVEVLTTKNSNEAIISKVLSDKHGPIAECYESMKELEKILDTDLAKSIKRGSSLKRKRQAILVALAWPLKEKKARKLVDNITNFKATITLALTTESVEDIKDIKGRTLEIQTMLQGTERREVYKWLQHTDPSEIHHRAQRNCEPGTGDWVTTLSEWEGWVAIQVRCLWIHGIPGAGKTVLVSHLIKKITEYCDNSGENVICIYYYCYYGHNQDETKPFLRWIIQCLCQQADIVPVALYKLFCKSASPQISELLSILETLLDQFEVVYVVIDAIDESDPRIDLLKVLRDLIGDQRFRKLQLLVSSREYSDIQDAMHEITADISMDNSLLSQDIRSYVHSTLSSKVAFRSWPQDILKEAEDALATNAKGMFRWAFCQIDVLQRLKCDRDIIEKELRNLPKTLYDVYTRIWSMIPEEETVFVFHVFQWIIHHNELNEGESIPIPALLQAAEMSVAQWKGHPICRNYDENVLMKLCGCLLRIEPFRSSLKNLNYSMPTDIMSASFAHYTVPEFLSSRQFSSTIRASSKYYSGEPRSYFMKIVFTEVLQLKSTELLRTDLDTRSLYTDFKTYCVVSALSAIFYSLCDQPSSIDDYDTLCDLAIDILDPSRPHFQALGHLASMNERSLTRESDGYDFYRHFWTIEWDPSSRDRVAAHLFNLMILVYSTNSTLAKRYLRTRNVEDLSRTRLKFSYRLPYRTREGRKWFFDHEGSIFEVLAQLPGHGKKDPGLLLNLVAELNPYEPSKILLYHIGSHNPYFCQDSTRGCLVKRLLNLGADPNIGGYRVTPLQIAVQEDDEEGVVALLEAGADKNAVGDANGVFWQDSTPMSRYNDISGKSPLYINEACFARMSTAELSAPERYYYVNEANIVKIALLKYGARSFVRS